MIDYSIILHMNIIGGLTVYVVLLETLISSMFCFLICNHPLSIVLIEEK